MSPTKPSTASANSQRPKSSPKPSAIPRRVKTSNKLRKPLSTTLGSKSKRNVEHSSVLDDPTATVSTSTKSYFSKVGFCDKENMPARPRDTVARTSPTRGKTGISKKIAKYSPLKRSVLARVPLRELSEVEVFERDEATLGDVRRRRSGEHSGTYIEFDSHDAHLIANDTRGSSVSSSFTENTISSQSTAITEPDEDNGKFSVLRRTDSEESLRLKVEAIMAATAGIKTRSHTRKLSALRHQLVTPMKSKHPGVRNSISPVHSFTDSFIIDSPEMKTAPLSPSLKSIKSPVLAPRGGSPIYKPALSPKRPLRTGLGKKSANVILNEIEKSKPAPGEKKKIVISANDKPLKGKALGNSKPKAKKTGASSLRRAAGAARPAIASAMSGLENIRRMR
ncbi:hypothetical protein EDC01DRAFT_472879 [Geopyxis carbonaria]|nr:hypothetical protein EDC01DRAFT_472879 [Geopyxis carbonaria]